jgi:hypothetical protein
MPIIEPRKGEHYKDFEREFNRILKQLQEDGYEIIHSHIGELTSEEVTDYIWDIEHRLKEEGEKKTVIKKLFSLLVEALQNIRIHGADDSNGIKEAFFIVARKNNVYKTIFANIVDTDKIARIEERIAQVNNKDKTGLKELYLEVLTEGKLSDKGGAGLGFITIAMKSQNPIEYKFEPLSDGQKMFVYDTVLEGKSE